MRPNGSIFALILSVPYYSLLCAQSGHAGCRGVSGIDAASHGTTHQLSAAGTMPSSAVSVCLDQQVTKFQQCVWVSTASNGVLPVQGVFAAEITSGRSPVPLLQPFPPQNGQTKK